MNIKNMMTDERCYLCKIKEYFLKGRYFVLLRVDFLERSYELMGIEDEAGKEMVMLDLPQKVSEKFFQLACEKDLSSIHLKDAATDYCFQWEDESNRHVMKK